MKYLLLMSLFLFGCQADKQAIAEAENRVAPQAKADVNKALKEAGVEEDCDEKAKKAMEKVEEKIPSLTGNTDAGCTLE
jgi:hypothetical protein